MALPNDEKIVTLASKRTGIGSYEAGVILEGDPKTLDELRAVLRGEKSPPDLSDVLSVQLGLATESFNASWFARHTGFGTFLPADIADHAASFAQDQKSAEWKILKRLVQACERSSSGATTRWRSKSYNFMIAKPDRFAYSDEGVCIVELKHVNPRFDEDACVRKYYPQVQHQLFVMNLPMAYLSVIYGNERWQSYRIEADPDYQAELVAAEEAFWESLDGKPKPVAIPTIKPGAIAAALKIVDMTTTPKANEWASMAHDWLESRKWVQKGKAAESALKAMMPPEAKEARGAGVFITRNKTGALSLKPLEG